MSEQFFERKNRNSAIRCPVCERLEYENKRLRQFNENLVAMLVEIQRKQIEPPKVQYFKNCHGRIFEVVIEKKESK